MKITAFQPQHLPEAADLFASNYRDLRQSVPLLSSSMQEPSWIYKILSDMLSPGSAIVALQDGNLVGYMGWTYIERLRNTERKAVYCQVTGHAALPGPQLAIYRAMYRVAAESWSVNGCQSHVISLMAHDPVTVNTWFWNGFGLTVVDALRSIEPVKTKLPMPDVRQATREDATLLAVLESEHFDHYTQPPVLMRPGEAYDAEKFTAFLQPPLNSAWIALINDEPAGYMRFQKTGSGTSSLVHSEKTIANTGAYVRPAFRGKGVAIAMLNTALNHYAALGFESCSVDFESFNPDAVAFWTKHFTPVCYSLIRVPEL